MDEPTADPTPTTARPDGPGTTQDSGDGVFYGALLGAIAGIIAAGVFGLMIGNPGLKQIDDPGIFISAATFAAVVLGMACSLAWGAVVGAVTRSTAATHDEQMSLVAIMASVAAALLLMLVAQPLAGPIALLSIGLLTAYFAVVLIGFKIGYMRRRADDHRARTIVVMGVRTEGHDLDGSTVEPTPTTGDRTGAASTPPGPSESPFATEAHEASNANLRLDRDAAGKTPARVEGEEDDEPRGAPVDRPSFDAFVKQLATLSSDEARALAELARVPDWRRDRDIQNFVPVLGNGAQMGYGQIASDNVDRSNDAVREARRIVGQDAVKAAKQQAARALAEQRLSWRGMRLHRPVRLVMWGCLAAAGVVFVLRPRAEDQATVLLFMVLLSLAALSALAGYLLPPDHRDLRSVVELAAVAHIAGPDLAEEHFSQLAGGWYAVREGRWSRGHRPYYAWGCFFIGVAAVVILGVVLELTGAGK